MRDKTPHSKSIGARIRRWSVEILILLVTVFLIHLWQTRDMAAGEEAPELSGQLLDGSHFELENDRQSPLLVHFWATWCPICRLEADNIDKLAQDYPVITVAMRSGENAEILSYLKENDLEFPVISDPLGQLSQSWGVKALPVSFVLDRHGMIRFVEVGYTTSLGLRLRLWWSKVFD